MPKKVSLFLMLALLIFAGVSHVAADTRPLSLAVGYEQALNLGDFEATAGLFADDARFVNTIGAEAVIGRDAIRALLENQSDPDRSYEVIWVTMAGNNLTMMVDISDRGIAWGRQTLDVVVADGQIQSMETVGFRFLF